jgi:hypothetical protein
VKLTRLYCRPHNSREAELDDLWRYVETTLERARNHGADANVMRGLGRLLGIIMEAHDLAGDGATREAAQKLCSAMVS